MGLGEGDRLKTSLQANAHQRLLFLDEARKILLRSSPNFDFRAVAELGNSLGVFDDSQSDRFQFFGETPDWVKDALYADGASTSNSVQPIEILSKYEGKICAPPNQRLNGPHAQRFVTSTECALPVKRFDGGRSRHFLHNFRKLSTCEDGVISEISDPDAQFLTPFLEAAEPLKLNGRVFLSVVEGSYIYTHWLLDTLPRLLLHRELGHLISDFDYFVFASKGQSFQKESLELLGIPDEKVIDRNGGASFLDVERFTFISNPRTNFVAHPMIYDLVRRHFLQGDLSPRKQRRFFVSRSGAKRRRILNEDELFERIAALGFEKISFEDYSVKEAAMLMSQASHVIAPHGAGLANLVFANPGAKVLEIFSAHLSREYWLICNQRNLEYHAFEAFGPNGSYLTDPERRAMPFMMRNGLDMSIPLERFVDYLKKEFLKSAS